MVTIHVHKSQYARRHAQESRISSVNTESLATLAGLEPLKGSPKAALRIALGVAVVLGILLSTNAYAYAPTKALKQISPKEYAKAQLPVSQYKCLEELYTRESNWRQAAYNPSGAYGIPQLKNKLIQHMNGVDQVRYGIKYIRHRYKTPCNALLHMKIKGWH